MNVKGALTTAGTAAWDAFALLLGFFGAALAALLISRVALDPPAVLLLLGLSVAFVAGLSLRALQWLPLGQRSLVTLFALRPLLDSTQLREAFSKAGFSLQNAY